MRRAWLVLAICLTVATVATAATEAFAAEEKTVPTAITADRLTYGLDGGQVVFQGQVHVVRPDLEIWSDKMTAVLAQAKDKKKDKAQAEAPDSLDMGAGGIERIVATGGVRMRYQGKEATCAKATLYMDQGLLELEGDPVIRDGANSIKGQIIRLYLKDNRSEVVGGGNSRVEAVFQTPEGTKPK